MYQPSSVAGPVSMGELVRSVVCCWCGTESTLSGKVSLGWLTQVTTSWCRVGARLV